MTVGVVFFLIFLVGLFVGGIYLFLIYPSKLDKKAKMKIEKEMEGLTPEQKLNKLMYRSWKDKYGSLPETCPNCYSKNSKEGDWGPVSTWKLIATKTEQYDTFDKAYRLGGATTVFTKKATRTVETYKCPNCNYTHTM